MIRFASFCIAIFIAGTAVAAEPARILILGTHHFAGSTDFIKGTPEDITSERRQREVEELVRRLAEFRPNKIAVEIPYSEETSLNSEYQAYVAGTRPLGPSEDEQVGFRLARRLQHPKIYAIDYRLNEDMGRVMSWAAANGDEEFVQFVQQFGARMQAEAKDAATLPLLEVLRRHNTPEYDNLHSNYMRMARVGTGTEPVGAEVVADRYERNVHIFANLARATEPGDRILVIYGASHGKLLRDFVRESTELELEPIAPYLVPAAAR